MSSNAKRSGKVYLVGAGPGDPGLITLRAVECLRAADVVLYDYLVNPRLLRFCRAEAEQICLGQHGRSRIWTQDEINTRMIAGAAQGQSVVRLKGGDPAVFARAAEELECLVAGGIPFEVVPGITAALAASSYAGIPITHRDQASAVALVTGQERAGKQDSSLDYAALAAFPGTLVFYMGVTTVAQWTSGLLEHGKPAETPAAIIRRCSFANQRTIHCTLGDVARQLTPSSKLRPPVIVIVGEVATLGPRFSWFEKRPLFGTSVLVTRSEQQAESLIGPLETLGAEVLMQPAITIEAVRDPGPLDDALARLDQFDWLVFSSSNGVRFFMQHLLGSGRDLRSLSRIRLAAIGSGTAEALTAFHLRADRVPHTFRAEAMGAALHAEAEQGQRFLLLRASRGREVLPDMLVAAGGTVEQVVVYESRDVAAADPEILERLQQGGIDWVTVTSSAIARSLVQMFGERLRQTRLASISPITSATLHELGFPPSAEAAQYTMEGLVEVLG